jgi:hypothetical protein
MARYVGGILERGSCAPLVAWEQILLVLDPCSLARVATTCSALRALRNALPEHGVMGHTTHEMRIEYSVRFATFRRLQRVVSGGRAALRKFFLLRALLEFAQFCLLTLSPLHAILVTTALLWARFAGIFECPWSTVLLPFAILPLVPLCAVCLYVWANHTNDALRNAYEQTSLDVRLHRPSLVYQTYKVTLRNIESTRLSRTSQSPWLELAFLMNEDDASLRCIICALSLTWLSSAVLALPFAEPLAQVSCCVATVRLQSLPFSLLCDMWHEVANLPCRGFIVNACVETL